MQCRLPIIEYWRILSPSGCTGGIGKYFPFDSVDILEAGDSYQITPGKTIQVLHLEYN